MTVHYEWDIETISLPEADVLDHDHRERLDQYDPDTRRSLSTAVITPATLRSGWSTPATH